MARGIEKRPIVDDDRDMDRLMERLAWCVVETDISVFAWVLMSNHLHLLVRTGKTSVSTFMQKLLTGHAVYYNKRHERVGHLFQNRFKSILVQEEEYLMDLVRYIHRNPLRAGLVRFPEYLGEYRWSGHRGLVHRSTFPWMSRDEVLDHFPGTAKQRISAYTDFVVDDRPDESVTRFMEGSHIVCSKGLVPVESTESSSWKGDGFRLLGSRAFGLSIVEKLRERDSWSSRSRSPSHQVIALLTGLVEDHWKMPAGSLRSGGRRESTTRAREVLSYLLVESLGLSLSDSASILGVSRQGVCYAIERFRRGNSSDPEASRLLLKRAHRIIGQ